MTKTNEQLRREVFSLDLEPVKFKLISDHGWDLRQADRVEHAYKCFLYVAAKYPDQTVAPTPAVDEMWHAHILDTRKYADDCARVLGRFLHHYPYAGMLSSQDADNHALHAKQTAQLVNAEFGVLAGQQWTVELSPGKHHKPPPPCADREGDKAPRALKFGKKKRPPTTPCADREPKLIGSPSRPTRTDVHTVAARRVPPARFVP